MKSKILFICNHNACRSQIAEGIAKKLAPEGIAVASAGIDPTSVHQETIAVMKQRQIDISSQKVSDVSEFYRERVDLIITLSPEARDMNFTAPGIPTKLHWDLPDPFPLYENREQLQETLLHIADRLEQLISDFFTMGTYHAIMRQKKDFRNLIDSLSEGILAHDLQRRVILLSRGAEMLTGYKEDEVLGKDCHELFPPSLCGKNCSFCHGENITLASEKRYSTALLDIEGKRRELDVVVTPLDDASGVVATLSDKTVENVLRRKLKAEDQFQGIIGQDYKMQHIYELIRDLSQTDFPVIITGDSGTGKELVAQAIHNESPRKNKLFVPINCGALPEGTLESELFGHVKGAFTGAIRDKKGRFELAHEGTLFLDEVAEMSPKIQVKLLRVLQEGTFEPVGGEQTITVNVRIVSATNKNLKEMVRLGEFREDLYYRLCVVPVEMPPLRERRNDIVLLANHFVEKICAELNRDTLQLSHDALSLMMSYSWPGNVRQLQSAIQYTMIKCRGESILPEHLPPEIINSAQSSIFLKTSSPVQEGKVGRKPKLTSESVELSLRKSGGNKAKAARILGVGRATLYNFLRENPSVEKVADF